MCTSCAQRSTAVWTIAASSSPASGTQATACTARSRRMLGTAQHSVVDVLGNHLQVVWGALVALVIVVLLTPAVGGMARLLGAVDAPGGRRLNRSPVPRLGGVPPLPCLFRSRPPLPPAPPDPAWA